MTDFFSRQEQARKRTRWLTMMFIAAVVGLIVAIYLVAALAMGHGSLWRPQLLLWTALGVSSVVVMGSLFKTMQLREGGSAVAQMLGGRLVESSTRDPDERKLLNVVEEMSIASGTPVPAVYILDGEEGINAFAAGHDMSDMAVAATRGCIRSLTRDELQGVIGHEFSHILNGDMALNIRLMGTIFGILCLAEIGRFMLRIRSGGGGKKDSNPLPLIGLALLIIGYLGVLFGNLIKAAVSRQREYLADASSVQFTRNPDGLAGALKKIGALSQGSQLRSESAEEASHMFFANGLAGSWLEMFATHPPLVERIKAIDPTFDGVFPPLKMPVNEPTEDELAPPARPRFGGATGVAASSARPQAPRRSIPPPLDPQQMIQQIGTLTPTHLTRAAGIRKDIPDSLTKVAREPFGASALIYALLLSSEETLRESQIKQIATAASPSLANETQLLYAETRELDERLKLPLVDLSIPALRQFSPRQYEQFIKTLDALIQSDAKVDLFEYALQRILRRHLGAQFHPVPPVMVQYYSVRGVLPDCVLLLSALAHSGSTETTPPEINYKAGWARLNVPDDMPLLAPLEQCGLQAVEDALERLNQASAPVKKQIISACINAAAADGVIQSSEAELVRAIADTLGCPMPPMG